LDTVTFFYLKTIISISYNQSGTVKFTGNLYLNSLYIKLETIISSFYVLGLSAVQVSSTGCNQPKFVILRPENNSFLNVRNRFCLITGKSLRQCEEICETAYWQKIRKKGQPHFKSPGPCVHTYIFVRILDCL
jgi:hypothetical protein